MTLLVIVTLLRDGERSLHKASKKGHDKIVDMLLKNGADPNVLNK